MGMTVRMLMRVAVIIYVWVNIIIVAMRMTAVITVGTIFWFERRRFMYDL
jgi:hypothetical protein